ncbi:MBL fold metallo-hydrolase [Shewanella surugensis]|uniref:MBL fold metallo-hydrolase n=1 Tax=Shewanella surugensis TaxID=212020 RepID=A0ABT0LEK9_9GAMM|nr:MBL fold metallo-hydrolase [Shewanella surugensis]MCL1126136.1 MBL fold metallo-hydrolase [Shewanella surugensis]
MQLHHIKGYIQSIYLVEYPDKLLLLDGCSRADVPLLQEYIQVKLQRELYDLKLVMVTHMHPDHAGAADLLRRLTGCKIATANVSGQWYSGMEGRLMHLTDILLTLWVANKMKKPRRNIYYSSQLQADYQLNDDERLPDFDDWKVISTQGHTDRDISLYHKLSDRLYVADLMVKVKTKFIPPFPVFYPNRYRDSLKKVQSLNPKIVALAHGGEVKLTAEDYRSLIQHAPKTPMTHWRSVKAKLKKVFS